MTVADGQEPVAMTVGAVDTQGDDGRRHRRVLLPSRLPSLVQWLLLIAAVTLLLRWVEPTAIESPYNGF